MKKKQELGNQKESCTNISANRTITTTEEATVYVRELDMCITVQSTLATKNVRRSWVLFMNGRTRVHRQRAGVIQDLARQWIQSYPCRNKIARDTMRSLQRFLFPERQAWSDVHWSLFRVHKSVRGSVVESSQVCPAPIRNTWNRRKSVRKCKRSTSTLLVQSG